MAGEWEAFMLRMSKLDKESKAKAKKVEHLNGEVRELQRSFRAAKHERDAAVAELEELENEKKAMMAKGGAPRRETAEAVKDTPTPNKARPSTCFTPDQDNAVGSPASPTAPPSRRDSVVSILAGNTTLAKPTITQPNFFPDKQDKDNITVAPKSTPDRAASVPSTGTQPAVTALKTLDTSFTTKPNNFWYQCVNTNSPIHPSFPTVINMDGAWTDISCGVCGANSFVDAAKVATFYTGMVGLYNHASRRHNESISRDVVDTVRSCNRRIVPEAELEFLRKGEQPTPPMIKHVFADSNAANDYHHPAVPVSPSTPAPVAVMQSPASPVMEGARGSKRKIARDGARGSRSGTPTSTKRARMSAPSIGLPPQGNA